MKKFSFLTIMAALILFSVVGPSVRAENTVSASILNYNENATYHIFDSPSKIFCLPDGLYVNVSGGTEVYSFLDKTIRPDPSTADEYAYTNEMITLSEGKIGYSGKTLEGEYSHISSYGNDLYALGGNTIYKFSYENGELIRSEFITHDGAIEQIAATESGCAYTALNPDGIIRNIYYNGKKLSLDEEVIRLAYNGTLYALTSSKLLEYENPYTPKTYNISGALDFALGDGIYVLTKTFGVDEIALDLSSSQTLIAFISDADWFYYDPVSGSVRLNKIYVADRGLHRVAVIEDANISYITGVTYPTAVVSDNYGKVYVAHSGNIISTFSGGELTDTSEAAGEIVDLEIDQDNNLMYLTADGNVVNSSGETVKSNVKAFAYQNGWKYFSNGYIDDVRVDATDFCVDISGKIFTCKAGSNVITAIKDGELTEYTVSNVSSIDGIAISKADNSAVSYGDLVLFDSINKCVSIVKGSDVGSADVKKLYPVPELTADPISSTESIIATAKGDSYLFALPVEGEITGTIDSGEKLIICREVTAPDQFVYCISDDLTTGTLKRGFVYSSAVEMIEYTQPVKTETKVNADNTEVYKYPTSHAPVLTKYDKNKLLTILPFAVNSTDEYGEGWYEDAYGKKWYRISYEGKEAFILSANTNVDFFSNVEMPKTNATITEDAELYRYDESSRTYVPFNAIGHIAKGTRVVVSVPHDTSRKYTKVVFYRDGYGTVDAECYVKTEYVDYDGVDIIKIIAIAVIIAAVIVLVLILIRRNRLKRNKSRVLPE